MGEFRYRVNNVSFVDGHMFMDRYNGAYLIDADGVLCLVDTGITSQWEMIRKEIEALGYDPADVQYIFCTHPEHNYSGGNAYHFAEINPNVLVYANPMSVNNLTNPELELERRKTAWANDATRISVGIPSRVPVKNIRLFEDYEVIDINGYQIQCIYCPGHQPGNSSFYDPQNKMLLLGDTLGNYLADLDVMYPIYPEGADYVVLKESLKKLLALDIAWVAAAHSGFTDDPQVVQRSLDMHDAYLKIGEEKMKAGKAEEIPQACMEFFRVSLEKIRENGGIGRGEVLYDYAINDHLPDQIERFQKHCRTKYFPQYADMNT